MSDSDRCNVFRFGEVECPDTETVEEAVHVPHQHPSLGLVLQLVQEKSVRVFIAVHHFLRFTSTVGPSSATNFIQNHFEEIVLLLKNEIARP